MYCTQLSDASKVCCIPFIFLHTVPVAFYILEVHSTLYILTRWLCYCFETSVNYMYVGSQFFQHLSQFSFFVLCFTGCIRSSTALVLSKSVSIKGINIAGKKSELSNYLVNILQVEFLTYSFLKGCWQLPVRVQDIKSTLMLHLIFICLYFNTLI